MFQSAIPAVTTITVRYARKDASPLADAASSMPPKNRITPSTGIGNRRKRASTESDRTSAMTRSTVPRLSGARPRGAHGRAARSSPKSDVSGHPTSTTAHWNATEHDSEQVHHAVISSEYPHADGPIREEGVVLLFCGDDRVAEGQGGLREREDQGALDYIAQP